MRRCYARMASDPICIWLFIHIWKRPDSNLRLSDSMTHMRSAPLWSQTKKEKAKAKSLEPSYKSRRSSSLLIDKRTWTRRPPETQILISVMSSQQRLVILWRNCLKAAFQPSPYPHPPKKCTSSHDKRIVSLTNNSNYFWFHHPHVTFARSDNDSLFFFSVNIETWNWLLAKKSMSMT